jgi:hypothetical protein
MGDCPLTKTLKSHGKSLQPYIQSLTLPHFHMDSNNNLREVPGGTVTDDESPFVASEDGGDEFGPRGVCGTGIAERDGKTTTTRTRDGQYISSRNACNF